MRRGGDETGVATLYSIASCLFVMPFMTGTWLGSARPVSSRRLPPPQQVSSGLEASILKGYSRLVPSVQMGYSRLVPSVQMGY